MSLFGSAHLNLIRLLLIKPGFPAIGKKGNVREEGGEKEERRRKGGMKGEKVGRLPLTRNQQHHNVVKIDLLGKALDNQSLFGGHN